MSDRGTGWMKDGKCRKNFFLVPPAPLQSTVSVNARTPLVVLSTPWWVNCMPIFPTIQYAEYAPSRPIVLCRPFPVLATRRHRVDEGWEVPKEFLSCPAGAPAINCFGQCKDSAGRVVDPLVGELYANISHTIQYAEYAPSRPIVLCRKAVSCRWSQLRRHRVDEGWEVPKEFLSCPAAAPAINCFGQCKDSLVVLPDPLVGELYANISHTIQYAEYAPSCCAGRFLSLQQSECPSTRRPVFHAPLVIKPLLAVSVPSPNVSKRKCSPPPVWIEQGLATFHLGG